MLYFHENQITYPWSPDDQIVERNEQYGFINFTSALAADVIWFNSDFHRMSFLDALPGFLKKYPDFQSLHRIPEIEKKAHTRWLGLPLQELDIEDKPERTDSPILLWNHRWEYDKDPDTFFRLCFDLADRGHDFRLIVLGEEYKKQPPIFSQARERLASRLLHWGYAKSRSEYARLLWQADILPVSSQQDFFGGSTVEAIYCNNYPILPNRLAFPEHLDLNLHSENLFSDYEELLFKTERALKQVEAIRKYDFYRLFVSRYDWKQLAPVYDRELDKII